MLVALFSDIENKIKNLKLFTIITSCNPVVYYNYLSLKIQK